MQADSRPLTAPQGMRQVRRVVRVRIADRIHARHVRQQAARLVRVQTLAVDGHAQVPPDARRLLLGEGHQEGGALDGLALGEVDAEEVVLGHARQARVGVLVGVVAVLQAVDGRDRAVLDGDVVQRQVLLPLRVGRRRGGAALGRVGAVDEGDDVLVERQDFLDRAGGLVQGDEQAEALVGVLVAVAPGAPENLGSNQRQCGLGYHGN